MATRAPCSLLDTRPDHLDLQPSTYNFTSSTFLQVLQVILKLQSSNYKSILCTKEYCSINKISFSGTYDNVDYMNLLSKHVT